MAFISLKIPSTYEFALMFLLRFARWHSHHSLFSLFLSPLLLCSKGQVKAHLYCHLLPELYFGFVLCCACLFLGHTS